MSPPGLPPPPSDDKLRVRARFPWLPPSRSAMSRVLLLRLSAFRSPKRLARRELLRV